MLDFLKSLFKPQGSSATAKERLRLVLLSDHLSLAPETIDALKADLFDVFSRYFEYDAKQAEVTFDHREREVAMLASVPILRVRDVVLPQAVRPEPAPAQPAGAASRPVPVAPPVEAASPAPEPGLAPESREPDVPEVAAQPVAVGLLEPEPVQIAPAMPRPRKRRRKRNAGAPNGSANGVAAPLNAGHSAQA